MASKEDEERIFKALEKTYPRFRSVYLDANLPFKIAELSNNQATILLNSLKQIERHCLLLIEMFGIEDPYKPQTPPQKKQGNLKDFT